VKDGREQETYETVKLMVSGNDVDRFCLVFRRRLRRGQTQACYLVGRQSNPASLGCQELVRGFKDLALRAVEFTGKDFSPGLVAISCLAFAGPNVVPIKVKVSLNVGSTVYSIPGSQ
jgi:hypothetical protein